MNTVRGYTSPVISIGSPRTAHFQGGAKCNDSLLNGANKLSR